MELCKASVDTIEGTRQMHVVLFGWQTSRDLTSLPVGHRARCDMDVRNGEAEE